MSSVDQRVNVAVLLVLGGLLLLAPAAQGAGVNSFSVRTEQDTYFLGGAHEASYTADQGRFTAADYPNSKDAGNRPRKHVAGAVQSNSASTFYVIDLYLPAWTPIQVGRTYTVGNAPAGDAFMQLTGGGICSAIAGSFTFNQYAEDTTGTPRVMDVSFVITCPLGGQNITLTGRFRMNATDAAAPADRATPVLTGLKLSRSRFAAGGRGTLVSWRLSEAAQTTLAAERATRGRLVGNQCRKPSRGNRGRRRCTRWGPVNGSIPVKARAGANRVRFRGRLGGRRLAPGRYRLVIAARDSAGNTSPARRVAFRITR